MLPPMASRSLKRFLWLPLAYAAAILLLLLLQFSGGERFSEKAGPIYVAGGRARAQEGGAGKIERLKVGFEGIEFPFGSDGIEVAYSDGRKDRLALGGYKLGGSAVEVGFEGGLTLRFAASGGDPLSLSVTARAGSIAPDSLKLRYSAPRAFEADPSGHGWSLPVEGGRILLAGRGKAAPEGGAFELGRSGGGYSPLVLERAGDSDKSALAQFMGQSVLDPAAWSAAIGGYLDKAYQGLASARFSSSKGGWARADGGYAFSERALVAALAEAMRRGEYPATREKFLDIIADNRASLGWLSATMLGSIRPQSERQVASDAAKAKAIVAKIEAKDPSAFDDRELLLSSSSALRFLLDRASYSAAESLLRFAADYDGSALGLESGMGLLRCLVDAQRLLPAESNPFAKFGAVAESLLLPMVKKMREGWFVVGKDGGCDLLSQLMLGALFMDLAPATGKDVYLGIGQSLVLSALELADSAGGIPETLSFDGGAVSAAKGSLPAESFYPLVAGNRYYPYELSLYRILGPGAWAWTSSPGLEVTADASRIVFNAEYPVSRSHFIALHGVKPFSKIQIYGIDYRSDPAFEQYDSSGWVYSEAGKVLYLKLKHKAPVEAVKLFYQAP